jgi:hypothetical protein
MWDFDGDEIAFFVFAGIVAFILAVKFLREIVTVSTLICPSHRRFPLVISPIICLTIIYFVLQNWSDPQTVRGHADYVSLFMAGGALWVLGSLVLARMMGISARDDAIERRNPAATAVIVGAMLGHTLCYAGSNIGSGSTIWTTLLPAIVASGTLMVLWMLIELVTRVSEAITIDRDISCAFALAGFLVFSGLDLGWAMSGDWHDWQSTLVDFARRGWPAAAFAFAAIFAIQIWKPRCTPLPTRH